MEQRMQSLSSIFSDIKQPDKPCMDHDKCISIRRLLIVSKYYELLQSHASDTKRSLFHQFLTKIYKNGIYDDFQHLSQNHDHFIYNIKKFIVISFHICINHSAHNDITTLKN